MARIKTTEISTDKQFEEEAIVFLNKKWNSFNENSPFNIEGISLKYVKQNDKFKYKDRVEADVLVSILVKLDYFKFHDRIGNVRYHKLTKKGLDFINEKRSD